ncbi:hypothetical protein ACFLYW_02205 [Thermodesulfobacteriota bacterium]
MDRFFSHALKKHVISLRAGEYLVSDKGEVLSTVLGSCISACIFDSKKKIGGMNHYLLPGLVPPDEILTSKLGRYGMFAMELLIGELIKKGVKRENLTAKIFGGGKVLKFRRLDGNVTESNISFVKKYLELEKIPILKEDLGGVEGRKIFLFTDTGRVLLKRFNPAKSPDLLNEEHIYKSRVFQKRRDKSSLLLFK